MTWVIAVMCEFFGFFKKCHQNSGTLAFLIFPGIALTPRIDYRQNMSIEKNFDLFPGYLLAEKRRHKENVFNLRNLDRLIDCSGLKAYRTK